LQRVDRFDVPARDSLRVPDPSPAWTFDAGSPIWAGPTYADGAVFFGAQNGEVTALDGKTGSRQWVYHAWGAVRARPTWFKGTLYFQADDGCLYAVDGRKGLMRWKQHITDEPIKRLPFDDPKSLYDRFSSDVTVAGDHLFVGTHEGRVLALRAKDGKRDWAFDAQGPVLAAPVVEGGTVIFGSYDHYVYAVDEKGGQLLWRTDTHGAVVSTPAVYGDRVIVGNRIYDLLALDLRTGRPAWKSYIWMSWVESSAAIRHGVAYVGSSDATSVYAYECESGKRQWASDVRGWSWGQPAVSDLRLYVGTSSQVGYPTGHMAGAMALDRETGAAVWRYPAPKPDTGDYGFAGSAALGPDLVYFAGLDGRVYAFEP
jgi:outer membrane protein assembly factor BamB